MDEKPEGASEQQIARKRDELLVGARSAVEGKPSGDSSPSLMGLGVQFALAILICLYAGKWLDGKLGTAPWLLVAGVVVGASAGFYSMYRTLMADNKKADRGKRR